MTSSGRKSVGAQGFSDVTIPQGLTSSSMMTSKSKYRIGTILPPSGLLSENRVNENILIDVNVQVKQFAFGSLFRGKIIEIFKFFGADRKAMGVIISRSHSHSGHTSNTRYSGWRNVLL